MKGQTGQCQCGRVTYQLNADAIMLYVCHCMGCQKQSSSAFAMSLRMNRDFDSTLKFWETLTDSGKPKVCAFCGHCGNRIFHREGHYSATINIKPGTLNDTSWLNPKAHIWTSRAQSWVALNQDLPSCEDQPEDMARFMMNR